MAPLNALKLDQLIAIQKKSIDAINRSTWSFGEAANKKALNVNKNGGSLMDSIEKGINITENDPNNSSVGIGGLPNSDGVVQLDACIMNGPDHGAGSVMALEGIKKSHLSG